MSKSGLAASRFQKQLFTQHHCVKCTRPTVSSIHRKSREIPQFPSKNQQASFSSHPPQCLHRTSLPRQKTTADMYPTLQRSPRYASLTQEHRDYLKGILDSSPSAIIDLNSPDATAEDIEPYNKDWMSKYRGQSSLVLRPTTTQQISQILAYCNEQKLAVVPQGGNSGLVGGSVPIFDEIVISLSRMNTIKSFDSTSGILVAEAGVILEEADNYLAERGSIFPLDLGAKGSCQLGGIVSTNAGGLRLLRYGSLHGNVLGIEAVLPDGRIVDDLTTLRKNNTGYDIKQLFIGGEGTIGIVTGVSVLCPQRSEAVNVAAFGVESYEKVQETFKEAKSKLSEIISAFEFMDARSQRVLQHAKDQKLPIDSDYGFYCLIETRGSNGEHDQEKLETFLEHVMSEEIVADGVLAQDQKQANELWSCREGITEALNHWGGVYKYDVSVPLGDIYWIVEKIRERLTSEGLLGRGNGDYDDESRSVVDVVSFGHIGDGNLHLNVPTRRYDKKVEEALEPYIYELVSQKRGSISAEHGLGLAKKPYIRYSRSENMVNMMKQIKNLYDPNGIMNPYKYI